MEGLLAQPEPEWVWGLVARGVGLCFLIAFCSLAPQVLPIAGRAGLLPIAEALRAQARDFPGFRRFVYFPTLLWLNSSDRSLCALIGLGAAAAATIMIGGPLTPYAFVVCWLAYLSLDRALTLIYPWDALLLEAGFWAAFLPPLALLPELTCESAASAPAAWAFRLLAFRVLFGFGKNKFVGGTRQDRAFLRGFLANQPLPTPLGLLAHRAPLWVHVFALFGLFLVEVIAPFAVFFPGPFATLAAYAVIGLMIGIHACGNYGHFNWVLSAVVLSWLDHATARQLTLDSLTTPVGVVLVVHTLVALLALPFNSFSAYTWTLWPAWQRVRFVPLRLWLALARWLAPFRLVHPYGVFPPQSPPSARIVPVAEVTWDGAHWYELTHRYWPSQERSRPRWCAPHHDRIEQAIVYESIGLNEMLVFRGVVGRWDPYGHGGVSAAQRLVHRVLAGRAPELLRRSGLPTDAPHALRVRSHLLEPAAPALRAQGAFWKRELIGPHFPSQTLADIDVNHPLPPPELWHFEDVYWLQRSRLGDVMARVARGADPHTLIAEGAPELAAEVETFWRELVPQLRAAPADSFVGLRARVMALRARYGRERLYALERIAGRYAAYLFARLEPSWRAAGLRAYFAEGPQALGVNSLYELRLLTHHIVAQGREAFDAAIAEPALAGQHAAVMTLFTGHCFQAVFRYEWLVYESQKLRLLEAVFKTAGRDPLSPKQERARAKNEALAKRGFGALTIAEFLRSQLETEEHTLDIPERWPRFVFNARAEVVRVHSDG